MTHGSLFSGIGGFDLASEWMGWENKFHCEWNEFGQKVLKHYWPKSESYGDITKTDFTIWNGRIDILTGGFPCQPYSSAGRRLGTEDERHLWPQMLRAIREIKPRWVVGENVSGFTTWNGGMVFEDVCLDLENEGYEVQAYIIPSAAVGTRHRRERAWIIAHANSVGLHRGGIESREIPLGERAHSKNEHKDGGGVQCKAKHGWKNFAATRPILVEGGFLQSDDGIPGRLDGITFPKWRQESIKAYGNAIVPQVAHQIFKSIEAYEKIIPQSA
jgi:DNA (cytosine-5)-methyltransferase 1